MDEQVTPHIPFIASHKLKESTLLYCAGLNCATVEGGVGVGVILVINLMKMCSFKDEILLLQLPN